MARASYLTQPTIQRIPNLLEEIRDGVVEIPRFQRPYVWTDQQRLELMESIYSGLPIGSLMVWRTKDQTLATYRLRGTTKEAPKNSDGQRQYLLDGHQRVVTLFTALSPGLLRDEDEGEAPPIFEEDEDDYDAILPLYFDLENQEFQLKPGRGQPRSTWLPLNILFEDFQFYEFQQELAKHQDGRALMNRARALHKILYDYTIAVVPLITDDLDTAAKSFERVNSAGISMSEVHMVGALTYLKTFDLNERLRSIHEELEVVGWQDLDDQMILNVCKAQLDVEIYRKNLKPLVEELKKDHGLLDEACRALKLAAELLARACDIYGPQTLPYSYQIVLLADVLSRHDGDPEELDEELATWLWATTYGEYFASMSSTRLRVALEHLREVSRGNAAPIPDDLREKISPARRFDFRAARSRVMALTMAEQEPVSPRKKPYENPHALLSQHGRQAMPKLLFRSEVGRRASEGFENRLIAAPEDIAALRDALRMPGKLSAQALESHGITRRAARALHAGRYDEFLSLRRTFFIEAERAHVEELGLTYVTDD